MMISLHRHAGFTLIETLIVICLLGIFVDLVITSDIDSYDRGMSRVDEELLVASLREARSLSMNSVCTEQACTSAPFHGLYLSENELTLFEGADYDTRLLSADITMPFSEAEISPETSAREVVFAPFTGDVPTDTYFAITGINHRSENVEVNTQGAIIASTTPYL